MPAFAGTVFININSEEFYFFLAAFFLPPFFFADFFAFVAMILDLHVELVRAQYIHKLKMASKRRVQFCCARSHRTLIADSSDARSGRVRSLTRATR